MKSGQTFELTSPYIATGSIDVVAVGYNRYYSIFELLKHILVGIQLTLTLPYSYSGVF